MDIKELRRYLNVVKRAVALIEAGLDNDDGGLLEQLAVEPLPAPVAKGLVMQEAAVKRAPQPVQQIQEPVQEPPPQMFPSPEDEEAHRAARGKHLQDLLAIDCWPEAVPPFLVNAVISEEDQINRANAVLDMMLDRAVEGKAFLDFGCGEGWITQEILKRGVGESLGYDIEEDKGWGKKSGPKFTTDLESVPKEHFDFVMLYDVLDHSKDPEEVMAQVKACLKPEGVVFVRNHPWTSRHATHLYKQGFNRAYWHLFSGWEEIKEMIEKEPIFTRAEVDPITAYHWWFRDFAIEKERLVKEPVSDFFHVPAFKELLANEQQIPMDQIDSFLEKMEIQFADYVLGPKGA